MNLPFHNPSKESNPSNSSHLKNSNTKKNESFQNNPSYVDQDLSDIENFPDFSQSLGHSPHNISPHKHQNKERSAEFQNPHGPLIKSFSAPSHDSHKEWNERPKVFVHRFGDPASSIKLISINAHDKSKDVIDSEINESKTGINLLVDNTSDNDDYKWTSKKDDALLQLALELRGDWSKVAQRFPDQNIQIKTLKTRYKTLMSVKLPNKARFSKKEDAKICRYYEAYGTNWENISKLMPGRTPTAIKNRFYSSLRDVVNAKTASEENPSENEPSRHHLLESPALTVNSMMSQREGSDPNNVNLRCSDERLMIHPGNHQIQFKENRAQRNLDCDQFFAFPQGFQENRMNNQVVLGNNQFRNVTILPTFQELPYLNLNNHLPMHHFHQPKPDKIERNTTEVNQQNNASQNMRNPTDIFEDEFQDPALALQELNERAAMLESLCHQIQDTFNEMRKEEN